MTAATTLDAPLAPATSALSSTGVRPRADVRGALFMSMLTAFEIGASIAIVSLVKSHGGSDFTAYLWSLVAPAVGSVIYFVKTRDLSRASLVVMAFNLLGAAVALLGSHDSRMLLYKDSLITAIVGLIFLGSLVIGRPVTLYYAQRFMATTPERRAWFDGLWRYPLFRRTQRLICVMWGVLMLVESAAKAWVIHTSSFGTAYAWDQVLPMVATGLGMAGTMLLVRRLMRQVARRQTASA